MKKMTLEELKKNTASWENAVIVISNKSFVRDFPLESRSYKISSSAKYFNPNMNGSSLFGNSLDGSDLGVRLDLYLHSLPEDGLGKRWEIEYCYILD